MGQKLLLAVVLKDDVLVLLNDCKALVELSSTILLTHESLELRELAGCDVDHLVFADVASDTLILTLVMNGSLTRGGSGGSLG